MGEHSMVRHLFDMLWDDLATKYLATSDYPFTCLSAQLPGLGTSGNVVFDKYGQLIDDAGYVGTGKQTWLNALSTQTWPCLAGQTIPYVCVSGE